ncbi:MAG: hypothetical protein WBP44_00140 [Gammaproteobacteria bacterium]|jgi:hypothetical protein
MAKPGTRLIQEIHDTYGLDRPSATHLLGHIFSSLFSSGMFSLLVPGVAIIVFLGYQDIPTGNYYALLFGACTVLAFVQGCKAWQEDRNNYQKALADARRTYNASSE